MATKTKSRAKTFFAVNCNVHGRYEAKGLPNKYTKVGVPNGKNARRFGGCPQCKASA